MKLIKGALVAAAVSMWAIPALAEDVKVGAVYSIEGIFSAIGGPERDGALLAVDQLNQAGGVGGKHVDLTIYDDGGDQAKAVQLANRLIFQDKVSAAFGPTVTPTGEMIAPVYEQNKVRRDRRHCPRLSVEGYPVHLYVDTDRRCTGRGDA